jgi:transcriptional regulator with XRE-family HTH domain
MTDNVAGVHGQYRRFTAVEVGGLIRLLRDQQGLKRAALAASANVSEKTVERAEAGKGISEECCRRIARVLGMREDALTEPLYIPTPEEAARVEEQRLEDLKRTHSSQPIQRVTGVREVLSLFGQSALIADDSHVEESHLDAFAQFQQLLTDWGDVASEIPAPDKIRAAQQVLESIRDLEALGYMVKCAVTHQYRTRGGGSFPCAVVVAYPTSARHPPPPDTVWLPKKFSI